MFYKTLLSEWKISLFSLILCPVLVKLGYWQLERQQFKLSIEKQIEQAETLSSTIGQATLPPLLQPYQHVIVCGEFIAPYQLLLDNKVHDGSVGYHVLSLFKTCSNDTLIVNNGWLARINGTTQRPPLPLIPKNKRNFEGYWMPFPEPMWLLSNDSIETSHPIDWPIVIQDSSKNYLSKLIQQVHPDALPIKGLVNLQENQSGSTSHVINYSRPATTSTKHLAYAVQWFVMAGVLLGLLIYTLIRTYVSSQHKQNQC